jgi:uncharacterized protein YmfQ (DUF2313 family)
MGITRSTPEEYYVQIKQLMPTGMAWPDDDAVVRALSSQISAAHNATSGMLDEYDPRTTSGCLSDWERVLGLPLDCVSSAKRRDIVMMLITAQSSTTQSGLERALRSIGYDVSVYMAPEPHHALSTVDYPLYTDIWRYAIYIRTNNQARHVIADVNSSVADYVGYIDIDAGLQCVVDMLKPAHTHVIYL